MFKPLQSREYGFIEKTKLFNLSKGNRDLVQRLKLDYKVEAHTGCVNTLCWSSSGQTILSGSDDQHLVITDPFAKKTVTSIRSGHRANIFSAKYLPFTSDSQIISCSGDGKIYYTRVGRDDQHEASLFDCHFGTTYEVIVVPNEASTFLTCGEDGTVRWFDLRIKSSCLKEDCKDDVLINCRRAVTSLAINPMLQYQLAIGCSDSSVRIFDRRMLGTRSSGHYTGRGLTGMVCSFTAPNLASRSHRITSLSYSPNGGDVLVSYSSEYVYLFGTNETRVKHFDKVFTKPEKSVEHGSEPKPLEAFPSSVQQTIPPVKSPLPASSSMMGGALPNQPSTSQGATGTSEEEGYVNALTSDSYPDSGPELSRQPPFKRLRMRGDWSDTGPNARPEAERNSEGRTRPPSIMQRMSDMLTRWLDGNLRRSGNAAEGQAENEEGGEISGNPSTQESDLEHAQAGMSQDASGQEGSVEMEGVVSGWQDMPSTSGFNEVRTEVDSTKDDTNSCEVPSEESQQDGFQVLESRPEHDSVENPTDCDNTQICDNSNDSHVSSDNSNSNIQPTLSPSGDNSDPDSNREESQLEPVISLHYSTEGTTSSTIRLGFARFENLEAGILQRSAENASLSPLVSEPVTNQDQSNVLQESGVAEACNYTVENDTVNEQDTENSGSTNVVSAPTEEQSSRYSNEEVTHLQNPGSVHETNVQPCSGTSSQTLTVSNNSEQITSELTTYRQGSESHSKESSTNDSGMGQSSGDKSNTYSISSTIPNLQIGPESDTNRESQERTESDMDVDSQAAPPPPLPRHRRIGRSGPPMGNIQLGLEVDSGDEEQEAEAGGSRPTNRDSLERHITAIKLQELYRKRQEEKEKEEMEMRNVYQPTFKMKFKGHRNARTMIKEANFWGDDYVMSGSDCGHIFIWDRYTSRLVMLLEGDRHVVNCLQPHPYNPLLASSGIDYDIKIWAPLEEFPNFNEDVSNEIMSRNEIMLEETRDTITVPAVFMLRVLASLNQIRAGRASVSRPSQDQGSSDSE